jgi:hypothetical protein
VAWEFYNKEPKMWYDDLCEYYNVSKEKTLELSTRSSGRKPSFPSSLTCEAVSGMSWEEIWDERPRETMEQKMSFYKDIGAWQSFRQCNYRKDFDYGYFYNKFVKGSDHLLEYGSGVAPMTNFYIDQVGDQHNMRFSMVEVDCEHYEFAKWRLNKKAPNTNFKFHEVNSETPVPNFGKDKFNLICMMDVLEHMPNPHEVMTKVIEHSIPGTTMLETWVDHGDECPGYADLEEAEAERGITMELINNNFKLVEDHGFMRVWSKK